MNKIKVISFLVGIILLVGLVVGYIVIGSREKEEKIELAKEVPILMYHHIEVEKEKLTDFSVTPEKFKKDMQKLKENGYTTICFEDLYHFVAGEGTLPEKPVLVTMDDGYLSNYQYAYPVLKELDMKATISVVGSLVGKDTLNGKKIFPHFDFEQAKEMYESGVIELASHTYDLHASPVREGVLPLPEETTEEYRAMLKEDFQKSKQELESEVGNEILLFTYPYGRYNEVTDEVIVELGYKGSLITEVGINRVEKGNFGTLFHLKRENVKEDTDILEILTTKD